LKTGAKNGFIPARKKSPCIRRFELRSKHNLWRAAALLLVAHVEKALPLLIDLAGEPERESMISLHKL
jgi:hypothetical protein